jgi:hypothetical protein
VVIYLLALNSVYPSYGTTPLSATYLGCGLFSTIKQTKTMAECSYFEQPNIGHLTRFRRLRVSLPDMTGMRRDPQSLALFLLLGAVNNGALY